MKKITVSDLTLKAIEEQGKKLTFREKLAIAEKLDSLKVDAIELPYLSESKENQVICRTISGAIKNAIVKIPVGSTEKSVNDVYESVKDANKLCLQVVLPVSTAQMEYFYHLKAPKMLEKIAELVKICKEKCDMVEFVAQDAFRAEEGFVSECAKTALQAGANAITLSDDAGEAFPEEFVKLVKEIKNSCDIKVYVQPLNSFDMATAIAIKAIEAGADGVKTSVCGNYLSLSTLSFIDRARKYDVKAEIGVDVTNVKTISSIIEDYACEESAEATVNTTEISSAISLKDLSAIVKQLGYEISDSDMGNVYEEFKKVTSKKDSVDTKELEAVIASTAMQVPSTYHLVNYVVNSGSIIPATANVTLEKDGEKFTGVSTGDGPIDAAFHAIEQIIGHHYELDDFQVHAVTKGRGAVGSSIIRLRADGKLYPGNGVSTDIVGACIRAYINAINKIVYEEK